MSRSGMISSPCSRRRARNSWTSITRRTPPPTVPRVPTKELTTRQNSTLPVRKSIIASGRSSRNSSHCCENRRSILTLDLCLDKGLSCRGHSDIFLRRVPRPEGRGYHLASRFARLALPKLKRIASPHFAFIFRAPRAEARGYHLASRFARLALPKLKRIA